MPSACACSAPWWSPARTASRPASWPGNDVARNALSFHLKELSHAGLVSVEQQGRNLIYRADFARMSGLLGYLTEHCCQGAVCEVASVPPPGPAKTAKHPLSTARKSQARN